MKKFLFVLAALFCFVGCKKNVPTAETMEGTGLSAPWITFEKEVENMFAYDNGVKTDWNNDTKTLTLYVGISEKAEAIEKLLVSEKNFGNINAYIKVIPGDGVLPIKTDNLYEKAFYKNPVFKFYKSVELSDGKMEYVVFAKQIVQFFNDDLTDYYGNKNILYPDLAKDIFKDYDVNYSIAVE